MSSNQNAKWDVSNLSYTPQTPGGSKGTPGGNRQGAGGSSKKLILIGAAALAVVVIIAVAVVVVLKMGGRRPEKAVDHFTEMIQGKADTKEKILKGFREMYPGFVMQVIEENLAQEDDSDFEEGAKSTWERMKGLQWEIVGKEKLKKDALDKWESEIRVVYQENVRVTEGWRLEVLLTLEGDRQTTEYTVLRVDGKTGVWQTEGMPIWYSIAEP